MVAGGYEPWVKELETRTGGRVKIMPFHGGSLHKANEAYELALKGALDITQISPTLHPGLLVLGDFSELPYLIPHDEKGRLAMDMVMENYVLPIEFSKVKVLCYHRKG